MKNIQIGNNMLEKRISSFLIEYRSLILQYKLKKFYAPQKETPTWLCPWLWLSRESRDWLKACRRLLGCSSLGHVS
jgi:hypothetical protein